MLQALEVVPVRLLVVEDNRDICDNIAGYLEKHSYVLDFAYDGISAMYLALTQPFDVIVLDLMLPGMDGLSFCHKLRNEA
ncbi:MAG: response regulator, partial [Gammaproteobacteria bacterium]|nr:response regulator [Gammaproteobacteria bacterium]